MIVAGLAWASGLKAQNIADLTPGDRVRVTSNSGESFTGNLIKTNQDSLILVRGEEFEILRLARKDIHRLAVRQGVKNRMPEGAIIGGLIGAPLTLIIVEQIGINAVSSALDGEPVLAPPFFSFREHDIRPYAWGVFATGFVAGAIIGGSLGRKIKYERWKRISIAVDLTTISPAPDYHITQAGFNLSIKLGL